MTDGYAASLEAQLENARRLLQISDERVTRLSGKADELEDSNHHLGEQNYILTGRIAELETALKEVEWYMPDDKPAECLWCCNFIEDGHKPDCHRQLALKEDQKGGLT